MHSIDQFLTSVTTGLRVFGVSIEKILEDGADAMESGGSLANFSKAATDIGGGSVNVLSTAGIFIAIVAIIIAGIGLMLSNSNTRDESKKKIISAFGGVLIIGGAVALVTLLFNLGGSFFKEQSDALAPVTNTIGLWLR